VERTAGAVNGFLPVDGRARWSDRTSRAVLQPEGLRRDWRRRPCVRPAAMGPAS